MKATNPAVSVIVPVYNGMPYFTKCLESLADQTLQDIEIVIVDDGSTDESGRISDEFAEKHSNVVVVHQENRGLYLARQKGLQTATGEYIGWVDADDFIGETMFQKLYEAAVENNSALVYCDYDFYPEKISTKEKWYRPYLGKKDVDFIERNNQPWNKIVRRSLMEELHIGDMFPTCFDEAYIKVLIHAENPVSLDEKLYFYRVGSGSMSSSYKNVEHYERFIKASENLKVEMKDEDACWQTYFDYRIIYYYLMTMLVAANAGDKSKYQVLKKKLMQNYPEFKKNRHLRHILLVNFGSMKSFAITNLITANYGVAELLGRIALGR